MKGGDKKPVIITKLFKDQRGMACVLTCAGMMVLVGMAALVADFGRIAHARQNLVNAVDSAALAGAGELALNTNPATREEAARQRAMDVAAANGTPPQRVTVGISEGTITVNAHRTVELGLAKAFGAGSKVVAARASAAGGGVVSHLGIAPLCIREQPLVYGQLCTLKYGSPDSPGNFGALALGGRGSSNYKNNLINGFSQNVRIGDRLETEPGNMSGPTDGIGQRLARCADGCTFVNFRPGCPKILVIPMHRDSPGGRDEITVTGFAAFFVDREATGGSRDEIKGYFVRMAADGAVDPSRPPTGPYGVKLTE